MGGGLHRPTHLPRRKQAAVSLLRFFRNYPQKFYLQTFLRSLSHAKVVFALHENRVRMLVREEKANRSTYVAEVQNHPGAPISGTTRAAAFRSLLASHKVPVGGKFIFLIGTDVEVRLLGSEVLDGIDSSARLRNTAPTVLLPTFERHAQYEWEFLTPEMQQLGKELPQQVVMVGMPSKLRRWIEGWTEQIGGEVLSIIPQSVATHHWCITQGATDFLLILGTKESQLAVVQDGQLKLLEKHADAATISQDAEGIAAHVRTLCREIKGETLYICRGDASTSLGRQVREEVAPLITPLKTQLVEPSAAAMSRVKATETPGIEAYIMESLT